MKAPQEADGQIQNVLQDKRWSFCFQIRGTKIGEGGRDCYNMKKT